MTDLLPPPPLPREEVWLRVLFRLTFEGDCWLWTGATRGGQTRGPESGRYGVIQLGGRKGHLYYVHRLVRWCFHGDWPEVVDHAHDCRRGICVNPDYLLDATKRENDRRAAALTNEGDRMAYENMVW